MAMVSLFCDCWMMNTIKKVMMVVPVLITSCQVSEKLKIGPVIAQTIINSMAVRKAMGVPVALVILLDAPSNHSENLVLFFFICPILSSLMFCIMHNY